MKIKEIIVVEGKDDTVAIKNALSADTIETNGSAINEEILERIRLAQKTRGVIIFTDPDYPGEKIRKIVSHSVSGCKHAFIPKEVAIAKNGKGIGVEHASAEIIRRALQDVHQEMDEYVGEIEWQDIVDAGLTGGERAKARRKRLGEILKIGYTNAKQLYKRLQMFQISKEEFLKAYTQVMQEEQE